MVTDSDSVELATFQAGHSAALLSGAATEKAIACIRHGGSVGVQ